MRAPERKALFRFVSLFIGLNTVFLLVISLMYYYYQKETFIELREISMRDHAQNVRHLIYHARSMAELKNELSQNPPYEISFFDNQRKTLFTSAALMDFPFQKGFFEHEGSYYFIDAIELENLKSLEYIVIRSHNIDLQLEKTRHNIYLFLIFSILFLSIAVYLLSKLFMEPVHKMITKLDHFIRDTTHELNTPLSVITMSIEQLQNSGLDPKHTKHIDRINVASRTISTLYDDLTFLLMYEQTKSQNRLVDLNALLSQRIDYFRPVSDAKKISIYTDFHPAFLVIDHEKIIRTIDNLLSNAIKYNKPSGDIYLTLRESSLSVRDTGIGIESDKINQIFNRYTRFDDANGGFGIGLNIIQMICNEYHFDISVESELLRGTTFTIRWDTNSH